MRRIALVILLVSGPLALALTAVAFVGRDEGLLMFAYACAAVFFVTLVCRPWRKPGTH